jgi:hypothetical protein
VAQESVTKFVAIITIKRFAPECEAKLELLSGQAAFAACLLNIEVSFLVVQQSLNLVTLKVAAKHELLLNKLSSAVPFI